MISVKNLQKFFNKGKSNEIHVINDVNLDLPETGMVAIFGKSGCGKTTLLNALGGLDKTDSGQILVDGQELNQNTNDLRNKYIGYIFQNYLLNTSVSCLENVAEALKLCGMRDKDELYSRSLAALENVGMDKFKNRTPDTLSGGQMQRIAIARAIVKNPRIILADEPTGNLDESNTVMIMDLLKEISKKQLVIIVTHEASLVDHYCDKVIEMKDGTVVNMYDNDSAGGLKARSKNDIYLGELNCTTVDNDSFKLDYYGEKSDKKPEIKLINRGGQLFISISDEKIKIIDSSSEIKLKEGVYTEENHVNELSSSINLDAIKPFEVKNPGKLFDFFHTLRTSFKNYHSKQKKKKASDILFRATLVIFSFVLVIVCAVNSTAFASYVKVSEGHNQKIFYVNMPNSQTGDRLAEAKGKHGIVHTHLIFNNPLNNNASHRFSADFFPSFSRFDNASVSLVSAVLPYSTAKSPEIAAGKGTFDSDNTCIITTNLADKIISKSPYSYIKDYNSIIGMETSIEYRTKLKVVGIVKSNEPNIYVDPLFYAKTLSVAAGYLRVSPASSYGVNVNDGEILLLKAKNSSNIGVSLNDDVLINGFDYKLTEIVTDYGDYKSFMEVKGYTDISPDDYRAECRKKVKNENPTVDPETTAFRDLLDAEIMKNYYEVVGKYYSHANEYLNVVRHFYNEFPAKRTYAYLASVKGSLHAKAAYFENPDIFYVDSFFRENGRYPNANDEQTFFFNENILKSEEELYFAETPDIKYINDYHFVVSDKDFVDIYSICGKTSPFLLNHIDSPQTDGNIDFESNYRLVYTLIYSDNPKETSKFLEENFSDVGSKENFYPALVTPDNVFKETLKDSIDSIIGGGVTILVFIALLSVSMYFLMRASIFGRIKEVGIYRAIGVSKKNILLKFFTETLVLILNTVVIGYLIPTIFISIWSASSEMISEVLYYPPYMAIIVLIAILAISLLFSIIPVLSLLRKTPAEIIAKYDI